MFRQVTIDDKSIPISIGPIAYPRQEDKALLIQLSEEVQNTGMRYVITRDHAIYLEQERAINLSLQLVDILSREKREEHNTGEFLFAVPFDKSVYIASATLTQSYVEITDEDLFGQQQALAKIQQSQRAVVFRGGQLSTDYQALGYTLMPGFDLHLKGEYVFRRALTISIYFRTATAALASVLFFYFASGPVLDYLSKPATVTAALPTVPTIENDLSPTIRSLAEQLPSYSVLLTHDLKEIAVDRDFGTTRASGSFRDSSVTRQQYERLETISYNFGAQLDVDNTEWTINPLPQSDILRFNITQQLRPFDLPRLLHLHRPPRQSLDIGPKTTSGGIRGYVQYEPTITIPYPHPSTLRNLANEIDHLRIQATYLSHNYDISNSVIQQLTIQFLTRGDTP